MHLVLMVSALITSVPLSTSSPTASTLAASTGVSLLSPDSAPSRVAGALLAQAEAPPTGDPVKLREYYRKRNAERAAQQAETEADDAAYAGDPAAAVVGHMSVLELRLQNLKRERSQMVSGVWAAGLLGGGAVTLLFTSIVIGAAMMVVGLVVALYYFSVSADLDRQIAETQMNLNPVVSETAPPRAPLLAGRSITVARF